MMNILLKVVLGDWSNDGHGLTETYVIACNLSETELNEAYNIGCTKLGFDFRNEVAHDYEQNTIEREHCNIMKLKGCLQDITIEEYDPEEDVLYIDSSQYLKMYLNVCKLGNPNFNYIIRDIPEIHAGGYGLFW